MNIIENRDSRGKFGPGNNMGKLNQGKKHSEYSKMAAEAIRDHGGDVLKVLLKHVNSEDQRISVKAVGIFYNFTRPVGTHETSFLEDDGELNKKLTKSDLRGLRKEVDRAIDLYDKKNAKKSVVENDSNVVI